MGEKLLEISIEIGFDFSGGQRHVFVRAFQRQLLSVIVQNAERRKSSILSSICVKNIILKQKNYSLNFFYEHFCSQFLLQDHSQRRHFPYTPNEQAARKSQPKLLTWTTIYFPTCPFQIQRTYSRWTAKPLVSARRVHWRVCIAASDRTRRRRRPRRWRKRSLSSFSPSERRC